MISDYLNIFCPPNDYPEFLTKYLSTKTMTRLKYIGQFCGDDYTNLYHPLAFYSRFDHSLAVALMTYHFTHAKTPTILALLHDIYTPCFAHTVDYVLNDYLNQETSEQVGRSAISNDSLLEEYLLEDNIQLSELKNLHHYTVLENHSPRLCTDRLDGVLGTCAIWLHTQSLSSIKEVYTNLTVIPNEDNQPEIGFVNLDIATKFVPMILTYAYECSSNRDKFAMKYISDCLKLALSKKYFSLTDLYTKKESEIVTILKKYIPSWEIFANSSELIETSKLPLNYHISFETKKRNVIPLLKMPDKTIRLTEASPQINAMYQEFYTHQEPPYAYIKSLKKL